MKIQNRNTTSVTTEIQTLHFGKVDIQLTLSEVVFPPSEYTVKYIKYLNGVNSKSAIDVGTGSGVIGIYLSKQGANVSATDISNEAIEVAKGNAKLNKTKIRFIQGSFFPQSKKKYNTIVSNLPQEIVLSSKAANKQTKQTIDGGDNGNNIIIDFLRKAKSHMNKKSSLYIGIGTLSDYKETINFIAKHYLATVLGIENISCKDFVQNNIEAYKKLNERGKIKIFREDNIWKFEAYILKLKLIP